ncbi:MAG TPA: hypothetical protein P5298_08630 [Spirochaetia bacterium]|nr:hypothetical protein [Spirochaetales bacterium]HRW24463.1 hypothetical protein [Spirochaetia bacterium]
MHTNKKATAMVAVMMIVALCVPAYAQGSFKEGEALSLGSEGGIFSKPSYAQDGKLVAAGAVDAFLLYDLEETRPVMMEVARFDTAHVATSIGGTALMIGGLATFFVAASGVSDTSGTISIYLTSAGLFLGSAGAWAGNWYCQQKRVALRLEAIDLYNRRYGLEAEP